MSGYGMLSPQDEATSLMKMWQRQAASAFDNLNRDPSAMFGSMAPGSGQPSTDPMASLMQGQQDQPPQAPVGGIPASSPLNEMTMMQIFGGGGDMGADFG